MQLWGKMIVRICQVCDGWGHAQDEWYGQGGRAHTVGKAKTGGHVKVTCTVCGNHIEVQAQHVKGAIDG